MDKIRPLWRHYYQNTRSLIFVVNINDGDRVDVERGQAAPHGEQGQLRDLVLLVFPNKQDLSNAMGAAEMTDNLGLHGLCQQWFTLVYRATMGDRLYEGLDRLLPLSRRDSWQLLDGALRRCCHAPRE